MVELKTTVFIVVAYAVFNTPDVQSLDTKSSDSGCTDAEANCAFLVTSVDICTQQASAAFVCAKTCNLCNVDSSSLTDPTIAATTPRPTTRTSTTQSISSGQTVSSHSIRPGQTTLSQVLTSRMTTLSSGSGGVSCSRDNSADITLPDTDHRTCYYYFSKNKRYNDAKKLCESIGAHVVHLETNEEELRLGNLMQAAAHLDQFWLGMESINGQWMWVGDGTQKPVSDDLWEGGHDPTGRDKNAYNTPPNHWKAGNENFEYKVVCEKNL